MNWFWQKNDKSIIDLINEVKALVRKDRKLKNAVTKSIIKILKEHGLIIEFIFDDHKAKTCKINSDRIKHLTIVKDADIEIYTYHYPKEFSAHLSYIFNSRCFC